MSSALGIWCDKCDIHVGHVRIRDDGRIDAMGKLATGIEVIGADNVPRPDLRGSAESFQDRLLAWEKAHGPSRVRYRFTCSGCGQSVPMLATKLAEVARRIQEHPAEAIAKQRVLIVYGLPRLKLSALRAMLSEI